MEDIIVRIKDWYRDLPEKKKYVEFITALLSIPVLLTVIIINLNNLNQQKNTSQSQINSNKTTPIQVVITGGQPINQVASPTQGASQSAETISATPATCINSVGPVSILSPEDGQIMTQSPVCITIGFQTNYCPVTWSYSLDGSAWSNFSNDNICLSGLQNGTRIIQLKIKSTTSSDQITLQRSFIYQGNIILPTPTPTNASSSAGL